MFFSVPPKVDSVTVNQRSESSITLQWNDPNEAWEYFLEINGMDLIITSKKSKNSVSYSISDLEPGTRYPFRVITGFLGLNSTSYDSFTVTRKYIDLFLTLPL